MASYRKIEDDSEDLLSQIHSWNILRQQPSEFLQNLRLTFVCDDAYVFTGRGKRVFMVTNDDQVWEYDQEEETLKEIKELHYKEVTGFSCGVHFFLAVTRSGSVYSRGFNDSGQLGNGTTKKNVHEFVEVVSDERMVQVRAGGWHSLALTSNGCVYGWGRTDNYELGEHEEELLLVPTLIPTNGHVIQVDCGDKLSGVLTDDGTVLLFGSIWKMNTWVCLWKTPTELKLPCKSSRSCLGPSNLIVDMSLGNSHVVCLTQDKRVFTLGLNEHGCLGVNEEVEALELHPNMVDISSVDDILVNHFGTFTACKLSNGRLLIWGQTSVGDKTVDVIKPTVPDCKQCQRRCKTLNDLHASHCMSQTMKNPLMALAANKSSVISQDHPMVSALNQKMEKIMENEKDLHATLKNIQDQSIQEINELGQTIHRVEKRMTESRDSLKEDLRLCQEGIKRLSDEQKKMNELMEKMYHHITQH